MCDPLFYFARSPPLLAPTLPTPAHSHLARQHSQAHVPPDANASQHHLFYNIFLSYFHSINTYKYEYIHIIVLPVEPLPFAVLSSPRNKFMPYIPIRVFSIISIVFSTKKKAQISQSTPDPFLYSSKIVCKT